MHMALVKIIIKHMTWFSNLNFILPSKENVKSKEISIHVVSESNYLTSLKDKEYFILRKLCSDSISPNEKRKLEKKLEEIRLEIKN